MMWYNVYNYYYREEKSCLKNLRYHGSKNFAGNTVSTSAKSRNTSAAPNKLIQDMKSASFSFLCRC